jgi:hypothetical protein
LWFNDGVGTIGRLTIGGVLTEFPLPAGNSGVTGITTGPDGALWFTETNGNIGRITTAGEITEFPIPTGVSLPEGITLGPDGALWFSEYSGNNIGRFMPLSSAPFLVNGELANTVRWTGASDPLNPQELLFAVAPELCAANAVFNMAPIAPNKFCSFSTTVLPVSWLDFLKSNFMLTPAQLTFLNVYGTLSGFRAFSIQFLELKILQLRVYS